MVHKPKSAFSHFIFVVVLLLSFSSFAS